MIEKMTRTAKILAIAFRIVLILFVCLFVVVTIALLLEIHEIRSNPIEHLSSVVPGLFSMLVGVISIFIIERALSDISASKSPFSLKQAKRIFVLGLILIARFTFDLILSTSTAFIGSISELNLYYVPENATSVSYINIGLLVASVACFVLSYIFKYGYYLQWHYDETV